MQSKAHSKYLLLHVEHPKINVCEEQKIEKRKKCQTKNRQKSENLTVALF